MLSCVSRSIDISIVAIKNIKNMHAVSTNQIAEIFHFNDNEFYFMKKLNKERGKENIEHADLRSDLIKAIR